LIKKRYIIIALGIVSVLLVSLFVTNVLLAQSGGEYDPWIDTNNDGIIDINDVAAMGSIYGTLGTPINKTKLLLELEARLDSLNASLLNDYYNITDCDSLFALFNHMHSGWDISGGTLKVDSIRLGTTEGLRFIYFYDSGSAFGESICWRDDLDKFVLSDDTDVQGTIDAYNFTMNPTTRYYSIPGSAWLPFTDVGPFYFYRNNWYVWTGSYYHTYWYAPINLPHGAVVTEFRAWVWDSYETDITVSLEMQLIGSSSTMASVSSTGISSSYQELSTSEISYNPIDNQNYAYSVYGVMESGDRHHRLSKVQITYTITEPLP